MPGWFKDNSRSIGRMPLVRLNRVADGAALIWDAEERGLLEPGKELVEPTRGNSGRAKRPENAGKTIARVPPDCGERYPSSASFEGIFATAGLPA